MNEGQRCSCPLSTPTPPAPSPSSSTPGSAGAPPPTALGRAERAPHDATREPRTPGSCAPRAGEVARRIGVAIAPERDGTGTPGRRRTPFLGGTGRSHDKSVCGRRDTAHPLIVAIPTLCSTRTAPCADAHTLCGTMSGRARAVFSMPRRTDEDVQQNLSPGVVLMSGTDHQRSRSTVCSTAPLTPGPPAPSPSSSTPGSSARPPASGADAALTPYH